MPWTIDDVDTFASGLPSVSSGSSWGNRAWTINEHVFAWHRAFSKADLQRFGDETPPQGDILAVRTENLDAKEALLEIAPRGFFTIPHFNGYAAVLIELRRALVKDVRAAVQDAYRVAAAAPPKKPRKPKPKRKARR